MNHVIAWGINPCVNMVENSIFYAIQHDCMIMDITIHDINI